MTTDPLITAALAAHDDRPRPPQWKLSRWAVTDYLLGTTLPDGTVISAKYIGDRRIIEVAVATLNWLMIVRATDRFDPQAIDYAKSATNATESPRHRIAPPARPHRHPPPRHLP